MVINPKRKAFNLVMVAEVMLQSRTAVRVMWTASIAAPSEHARCFSPLRVPIGASTGLRRHGISARLTFFLLSHLG